MRIYTFLHVTQVHCRTAVQKLVFLVGATLNIRMCIFMYMYICIHSVYTHTQTHTHTLALTHTRTHAHTHTHTYPYTYTHTNTHQHTTGAPPHCSTQICVSLWWHWRGPRRRVYSCCRQSLWHRCACVCVCVYLFVRVCVPL